SEGAFGKECMAFPTVRGEGPRFVPTMDTPNTVARSPSTRFRGGRGLLLQRARSTAQPGGRHGVAAAGQPLLPADSDEDEAARLHEAVWGLATRTPELSAATRLSGWQRNALIAL